MKKKELQQIAQKVINGTATEAEIYFLRTYYDAFDSLPGREDPLNNGEIQQLGAHIRHRIHRHINRPRLFRILPLIRYTAAAVLIVALAGGLYFFIVRKPVLTDQDLRFATEKPEDRKIVPTDILPGYNQATLTLADGRTMALSSEQDGIIVADDHITYADGTGLMENGKWRMENEKPDEGKGTLHAQRSTFNSITTPKGGQYQVVLPDGSKIWLNAASTLTYPSQFTGDTRTVELEGEAYFVIAKSGRRKAKSQDVADPFIVRSRNQETIVLGTEFNINSYDPTVKTTVVNGAVQVANYTGTFGLSDSKQLKPGQQAINSKGQINVSTTDINSATAWRSGLFYFRNTPFAEVMRQIARWYDLDIVYSGKIPQKTFSGKMKRDVSLNSVLDFIQGSGIDFRMEGRKLIID